MLTLTATKKSAPPPSIRRHARHRPPTSARLARGWLHSTLFEPIWQTLTDALVLSDATGRVLAANPAYFQLYGYAPADVVGQDFAIIFPPEIRPQARAQYRTIFATRQPTPPLATTVVRADGSERVVESCATFLTLPDGAAVMLSTIRDITARTRTEQALRAAQTELEAQVQARTQALQAANAALRENMTRLQAAQQLAQLGSWELNLQTNTLIWSDEIYRIFEIDPAQFGASYEAFLAAVHPADRAAVNAAYQNAVENRLPYEITHRLQLASGRLKWVLEAGQTEYDTLGRPVRSWGTVQDITTRYTLETQVHESEARFSTAFYHSPVAMAIRRVQDEVVLDVNQSLENLLQRPRAELIGRPVAALGIYKNPAARPAIVAQTQTRTPIVNQELQFVTRTGETLHGLMSAQYITLQGEACVLATFVDITARKQAEAALQALNVTLEQQVQERTVALRASEAILAAYFDSTHEVLFVLGPHYEILAYNKLAREMVQQIYHKAVAAGDSMLAYATPATRADFELNFAKALAGEQVLVEREIGYPSQTIWWRVTYTPVRDAQQAIVGVAFATENIQARKQTELALQQAHEALETRVRQRTQELQESEEQFRAFFEHAPDAVLITQTSEHILAANPAACAMFRTTEVMLQASGYRALVDAGEYPHLETLRAAQQETGQVRAELTLVRQDGTLFPGEVTTARYGDPAQPKTCVIIRDMTERKQAEHTLRLLSQAVEQAADLVYITNVAGHIEYTNPAFETITGYARTAALGQTPRILQSGQHSPEFYRQLWATILNGQVFRAVVINRRQSGELYHEDKTITPLKDPTGRITHFVSTGRDITARIQAEQQLHQSYAQLQASLQMGQAVAASLDLEAVLTRVAQEISSLLQSAEVTILLPHQQQLKFVAVSSPRLAPLVGRPLPPQTGVAYAVWQTQQTVYMADTTTPTGHYEFADLTLANPPRALLAVPMVFGGAVIGVIKASHPQPGFFSADDIHLMQAAAAWAAIAVHNADQHAALQRRLEENAALAEVSRALNTTLDAAQVLQVIVNATHQVLRQAEQVTIHLLDDTSQQLVPAAGTHFENTMQATWHLRAGEGIAGLVVQQGESINVPDIRADARYQSQGHDVPHLRSLLVAPIWSEGRALGTISAQSAEVAAFTDADDGLLTTLGINAATALFNAWLYDNAQRRARAAQAAYDVTRAISTKLDQNELLEAVVQAVAEVAQYPYVSIFWVEREGLRLAAYRGYTPDQVMPWLPPGVGIVGWAVEHQTTFCVPDVTQSAGYVPFAADVRSLVAAPLLTHARVVGVLVVEQRGDKPLAKWDEAWLNNIAQQVSIALENTTLYAAQKQLLQEREQAQRQLVQSEKMAALGRLVASLAHEINNPLQAIQGYLTLAEEEVAGPHRPEKLQRYLQISTTEIDRIAAIVQRMREFYRPARTALLSTDVHEIWQSVLDLTRKKIQHAHVQLQTQWAADLPRLEANPDHLKQVFLNLVLNALDAMPQGGILYLSTASVDWQNQPAVQVMVRDSGVGMTPEVQGRIFEPFFTSKEHGSGLGLSISYSLIQAHAGNLEVTSQLGQGSTFTIFLPVQPHGPAQ